MRALVVMSFLAAALGASAAAAQSTDEDMKCMLASNLFVKAEKDPAKRQVAVLSSYYYLGRVDARLSGAQFAAVLKAQARTLTPQTAGPVMTGCAKRLQSAGTAVQMLGKELSGGK